MLVAQCTENLAYALDQRIKTIIAAEKGVPDLPQRKVAVDALEAGIKLMGLRIAVLEDVPKKSIEVLAGSYKKEGDCTA